MQKYQEENYIKYNDKNDKNKNKYNNTLYIQIF